MACRARRNRESMAAYSPLAGLSLLSRALSSTLRRSAAGSPRTARRNQLRPSQRASGAADNLRASSYAMATNVSRVALGILFNK